MMRRSIVGGWLLLSVVPLAGCQSMPSFSALPTPGEVVHNLKPHRLWRLNRGSDGMSREAYFSVPDPIVTDADRP